MPVTLFGYIILSSTDFFLRLYFSAFSLVLVSIERMYQTLKIVPLYGQRVWPYFQTPLSSSTWNATCRGVFSSTLFTVFGQLVKHGSSCLIYYYFHSVFLLPLKDMSPPPSLNFIIEFGTSCLIMTSVTLSGANPTNSWSFLPGLGTRSCRKPPVRITWWQNLCLPTRRATPTIRRNRAQGSTVGCKTRVWFDKVCIPLNQEQGSIVPGFTGQRQEGRSFQVGVKYHFV